jgi:hypothetical protein
MRQVAIITKEEKDKLIGQQFMTDVYFNLFKIWMIIG